MAGAWQELFSQGFSSSSSVVVNHNLDRVQLAVMVLVDGASRTDLIQDMTLSESDPRNSLTVNLTSAQTGTILIVDMNVALASIKNPDEQATTQQAAVQGYGEHLVHTSDDEENSTTSTRFSRVLSLGALSLPYGKYMISWSYEYSMDKNNAPPEVNIVKDSAEVISSVRPEARDDIFYPSAGWCILEHTGQIRVEMLYRATRLRREVSIRRSRLAIWRVSS